MTSFGYFSYFGSIFVMYYADIAFVQIRKHLNKHISIGKGNPLEGAEEKGQKDEVRMDFTIVLFLLFETMLPFS